jgi:hypothetical protein
VAVVVVMAPVEPEVMVMMMPPMMPEVVMVMMVVAPVVPMMAVVPVRAMMTPVAPQVGPVSRHGGGRLIGILGHGGCVGGRLGGSVRGSDACRNGGDYQQPLEHETSSRVSCGTHRKAKERAMNPN